MGLLALALASAFLKLSFNGQSPPLQLALLAPVLALLVLAMGLLVLGLALLALVLGLLGLPRLPLTVRRRTCFLTSSCSRAAPALALAAATARALAAALALAAATARAQDREWARTRAGT
jgi:hypothetical protein